MANLNPKRNDEFKRYEYKVYAPIPGSGVLSKKPICVKFPVEVDARLRSMGGQKMTKLLRNLVWEWMQNNPEDKQDSSTHQNNYSS